MKKEIGTNRIGLKSGTGKAFFALFGGLWTDLNRGFRLPGMNKKKSHPPSRFLYLGDDTVKGAAAYLAGVMTHYGLEYEHRSSNEMLLDIDLDEQWAAVIISDYPAGNISYDVMRLLEDKVDGGMGFLMIGGWESYQGLGGDYCGTPLGNLLPVSLSPYDDRINSSGPCLISRVRNHPIIDGLPFESDAPGIGGFNRVKVREDGEIILEARRYTAFTDSDTGHHLTPLAEADPLLVTGNHGKGRVCAWTSDVAPHWVGGLVDWGAERVEARGKGNAGEVEVGDLYASFFANMLRWVSGLI